MEFLTLRRAFRSTAVRRLPVALALGPVLGIAPARAQGFAVTEPEMKAAFLYKFGKFVDWPAASFSSPAAPLELCVVGADAVAKALAETVRGKTIAERPLLVHRPSPADDLARCHLVFVGAADPKALGRIADRLGQRPTLIVAEAPEAAAGRGAAVNLVVEASRIRFEINPDAAERRGLRVSSKLLSLARLVRDGGGAD
jgi:hypothetical protein